MPKYPSTPAAPCIYPAVQSPMNKYQSTDQEFKTTLIFPKVNKWVKEMEATFKKQAAAFIKEEAESAKPQRKAALKKFKYRSPFRDEINEAGEETGNVLISFKRDHKVTRKSDGKTFTFTVPVFDAAGKPITKDIRIGNDSLMKVSYESRPYVGNSNESYGVSFRLQAVQLLKLVEFVPGGNADSFGFGTEEDGYTYDGGGDEAGDFFTGDDDHADSEEEKTDEQGDSDAAGDW